VAGVGQQFLKPHMACLVQKRAGIGLGEQRDEGARK
jgi:hypothetical protein